MIAMQELDAAAPFTDQLAAETGPVVLVNTFVAPEGRTDEVEAAWAQDAAYFQARPGYISTQLHRGVGASHVLVNVAVWESAAQLQAAFTDPEFGRRLAAYPDGTVATPHLLRRVAVAGVCVA